MYWNCWKLVLIWAVYDFFYRITTERHRAEVRRAISDDRLSAIAGWFVFSQLHLGVCLYIVLLRYCCWLGVLHVTDLLQIPFSRPQASRAEEKSQDKAGQLYNKLNCVLSNSDLSNAAVSNSMQVAEELQRPPGKHFIPLSPSTCLNSFLTIFHPDPCILPIQISLPDQAVLLATFPLGPFLCLHLILGTLYLHTFVLLTPYPPLNAT